MGKIEKVVCDAGPFIHLQEIKQVSLLQISKLVLTTEEILEECKNIRDSLTKQKYIQKKELMPQSKDFAKYILEQYSLDLGESTGIALCRQEQVKLFFTDDLDAREVSKKIGLSPHGTLGIILRALREKMLIKQEAKRSVHALYTQGTLFFTKELLDWTIKQIDTFKQH